eukprot:TRINITY_DN1480_c0_g6_i1.p1 TRINITY_DN1480_c0_g6~~TRINITY_DN1480_c0_g6_i1.p1  ORF type:complete len:181 (+),score=40.51 TRINITY_DN1480_c0_g6_i1:165-707(+)
MSVSVDTAVVQQVKEQIEKYLDDRRSKPRKLRERIHKGKDWVGTKRFLRVPGIQALTTDMNVLIEAIKLVSYLHLNPEGNSVRKAMPKPVKVRGEKRKVDADQDVDMAEQKDEKKEETPEKRGAVLRAKRTKPASPAATTTVTSTIASTSEDKSKADQSKPEDNSAAEKGKAVKENRNSH